MEETGCMPVFTGGDSHLIPVKSALKLNFKITLISGKFSFSFKHLKCIHYEI